MFEAGLDIVDDVIMEESDSLSNMPENLEGSDRYAEMEDNIDVLEDARSDIESAKNALEGLI